MRKIVSGIVLIASIVLFAQDSFNLHSISSHPSGLENTFPSGVRSVWGGTDLDQDGREEIWATDYNGGGQIHAFEWYYGDTLVHVWSSDTTGANYRDATRIYNSTTRHVQTGDLDGDGLGEVIFFSGKYLNVDSLAGLYVYEWDGVTDNGYGLEPAWFRPLHKAYNQPLGPMVVEHFLVNDVDGDGHQEIIDGNNGSTNPSYPDSAMVDTTGGKHAFSEDRFVIASVSGDIGNAITPPVLVEEYVAAPRDADKDGVRENGLGGGSALGVAIGDTDGDGKKEIACFAWNNLNVFFIEATGENEYTVNIPPDSVKIKAVDGVTDSTIANPDKGSNYKHLSPTDDWTLAPTVADMDGDGKDEIYVAGFDNIAFVIGDLDGDALTISEGETVAIDSSTTFGASASNNAFGEPALFFGGSGGKADLIKFDLTGSNVLDPSSWTKTVYGTSDSTVLGFVPKIFAGSNIDNDKFGEVILGYQSVPDSVEIKAADGTTDSTIANPKKWFVRVAEWTGASSELAVKDLVLITPEDYKLSQNYPNPFNPTTTIEYSLPIASKISISIFNVMGQEVASIIQNQDKPAGTYQVTWNGMDKSGNQVASGTYFYSMRFGNFTKTKQMTFMK